MQSKISMGLVAFVESIRDSAVHPEIPRYLVICVPRPRGRTSEV